MTQCPSVAATSRPGEGLENAASDKQQPPRLQKSKNQFCRDEERTSSEASYGGIDALIPPGNSEASCSESTQRAARRESWEKERRRLSMPQDRSRPRASFCERDRRSAPWQVARVSHTPPPPYLSPPPPPPPSTDHRDQRPTHHHQRQVTHHHVRIVVVYERGRKPTRPHATRVSHTMADAGGGGVADAADTPSVSVSPPSVAMSMCVHRSPGAVATTSVVLRAKPEICWYPAPPEGVSISMCAYIPL